jgi:hypothetical protein
MSDIADIEIDVDAHLCLSYVHFYVELRIFHRIESYRGTKLHIVQNQP